MPPKKVMAGGPRPATRAATAPQPPVVIAAENGSKRKRRTADEIQREKDQKEAAKAEKALQHQEKMKRIAEMESKMAAQDAKEKSSAGRPRPRHLQRTYAVADLMKADIPASDMESIDVAMLSDRGEAPTDCEAGDETDQETPKSKKKKIYVRESINIHAAQLAAAASSKERSKGKTPVVADNKDKARASRARSTRSDIKAAVTKPLPEANLPRSNSTQRNASSGAKSALSQPATRVAGETRKSFDAQRSERFALFRASSLSPISADESPTRVPDSEITPKAVRFHNDAEEGILATPGGLEDEDEELEREVALSSPIKAGKRLTTNAIVKLNEGGSGEQRLKTDGISKSNVPAVNSGQKRSTTTATAKPDIDSERLTTTGNVKIKADQSPKPAPTKRGRSKKSQGATSTSKLTNNDLPAGCRDGGIYRRRFIPTYQRFVASHDTVWSIPDTEAVAVMQKILNKVYKKQIVHVVEFNDAIFQTATQRMYEWRSNFGSLAIQLVDAFFRSDTEAFTDPESRVEHSLHMLQDRRFLYSDTNYADPANYRGVFRSPIVLQTFASHLSAIEGSIVLPGVIDDSRQPRAALALSAAAVERAFTLFSLDQIVSERDKQGRIALKVQKSVNRDTGVESSKRQAFGEATWGIVTQQYLRSVDRLRPESFDKIITKARLYMKSTTQKGNHNDADDNGESDDDGRANLVDLSSDQEPEEP